MHISTNFKCDIPYLYEQQSKVKPTAYAKYYVPDSDWICYALEWSKHQNLFYGYIEPEGEYGYFTVQDLHQTMYSYNVNIELDMDFKPQLLSDVMNE